MFVTTYAILFVVLQNVLSVMIHFNQLRNLTEYVGYDNNAIFKMAFDRQKPYTIFLAKIIIPVAIVFDILLLLINN